MVISNNLNRIKNILSGDYTAKTKVIVGHTKKHENHIEGDIWIEDGKEWTIQNGITTSVSKLSAARKESILPLCCPKCSKSLKSSADKLCWKYSKICTDCYIAEDTYKMATGELNKENAKKKKDAVIEYKNNMKIQFDEYIASQNEGTFVTEAGDIEDWSSGMSKEKLTEIFNNKILELEKYIETL